MSGTPGRAAAPPQPLGSPAAAAAAAGPAAQQPPWRAAANIAAAEAAGFVWTHVRGFSAWPSQAVPAAEVPRLITERQLPGRPAALADALLVQFFGTSEYSWVPRTNTQAWGAGISEGKDALPKLVKALSMAAGLAADPARWPDAWWSLPAGASPAPVLPTAACVATGAKRKRSQPSAAAGGGPSGAPEGSVKGEAPQMPAYVKLRRSEWSFCPQPRPRSKAASSVCECNLPAGFVLPTPAAAGDGAAPKPPRAPPAERPGCGSDCQNRLTSTFCDARTCPCGAACSNRAFHQLQQPRTKPFLTVCGRGWGLKAAERIPRDTFVVEYIGEILNDAQCALRLAADKEKGETNFYMMEVNRNQVIDARYKGNVSRLINSACAPNCETQRWVDGGTGETRVGIFTLRDVAPGEELTYDYCFFHFGDDTSTSFRCMCGAPACRGTLDANPQRGLNRGRRIEVAWDDGIFYAATVAGYNQGTGKFKLVYDDGDTETVRLEADASKRRAEDVVFRWLPDAPPEAAACAKAELEAAPAEQAGPRSPAGLRSPAAASPSRRVIGSPASARSPPSARGAGVTSPQRSGRATASPAARLASPNAAS